MKRKILMMLVIFHFVSSTMYTSDELKARIHDEQVNFPQGDLYDIAYIQSILHFMSDIDQNLRVAYIKDLHANGIESRDMDNNEIVQLMNQVTQFHSFIMKKILAVHGWITISKFGIDAENQAWLLIQHNDQDVYFQAGCLFLLADLVEKGETNATNYAYLYDRVALNFPMLGMKQRYGTQFFITHDKEIVLYPYDGTLQDLETRREQMGITQSIKDYIELIRYAYGLKD